MEPRPKRSIPEMRLSAAHTVAEALANEGHISVTDIQRSAALIAKYGRDHIDGYELAKSLDDHEGWDINALMVETLDSFSGELNGLMLSAEVEWAQRTNPLPPFALGTRVTIEDWDGAKTGILDGIYQHGPAKYLVKIEGDPDADGPHRTRRIINFEDARAVNAEVSA